MDTRHPETMLQVIVRAGQPLDVITVKEPGCEVLGDVAKVLTCLRKRPESGKIIPHPRQVCQIPFSNVLTAVLRLVSQDGFGLIQKAVGALQRRPELCCRL